jgi:hypothetical protein
MGHKPKLKGTRSNRGRSHKKSNIIKVFKDGEVKEGFMGNGILKIRKHE